MPLERAHWAELRGRWGPFPAVWVNHCVARDELVPGSLWKALRSLVGSGSLCLPQVSEDMRVPGGTAATKVEGVLDPAAGFQGL